MTKTPSIQVGMLLSCTLYSPLHNPHDHLGLLFTQYSEFSDKKDSFLHRSSEYLFVFKCYCLLRWTKHWVPCDQTQIVAKPKNSNFSKTQKVKLWQNSKTQIVITLKNYNCDRNTKNKFIELKFDKTQIVTKIKILNCDKTQLKLWQNSTQTVELTQGTTA